MKIREDINQRSQAEGKSKIGRLQIGHKHINMILAIFLIIIAIVIIPYFSKGEKLTLHKDYTLNIRGILALMIILFHCTYMSSARRFLFPFCGIGEWLCGIFFFISGFGMSHQIDNIRGMTIITFFRKRIWKVAKPFLIITLIFQILLLIYEKNNWNSLITSQGDTNNLLPYCWYVFVALLLYIITFVSSKQKLPLVYIWLLSIVSILILIFLPNSVIGGTIQ